MAFEKSFSVPLRNLLLITLLILIIHALSSDCVNGGVGSQHINKSPTAEELVKGNNVSDSSSAKHNKTKRLRKKTTVSAVSLPTPPGSDNVNPISSDSKQKTSQSEALSTGGSDDKADKGRLTGPVGSTGIKPATGDNSFVGTNDIDEDEESEEDRDKEALKDDQKKEPVNKDVRQISLGKPVNTGVGNEAAGVGETTYEGEDEGQDSAEIQLNPSGNVLAESGKSQLHKKPSDDVSSAGSFMTYFVIIAIVVIILYLILHNKKKLMAYFIEGRNTARVRRQRPTSGSEYKPLKNADEAPGGGRPDEA